MSKGEKTSQNLVKIFFGVLFIFYLLLIVLYNSFIIDWAYGFDARRYIYLAKNLSEGYFPPPGNVNLWFGPGLPLTLVPFVNTGYVKYIGKFLNCFYLTFSALYIYLTIRIFIKNYKIATAIILLIALYPPVIRLTPFITAEIVSVFLVSGVLFHGSKTIISSNRRLLHLIITSSYMAYLAITKVFYGYVLLTLCVYFFMFLIWKHHRRINYLFLASILGLLFTSPYLAYTYGLTGKLFYWGTSGGRALYSMSTPYKKEIGDPIDYSDVDGIPGYKKNHGELYNSLRIPGTRGSLHDEVLADKILKQKAIENIKSHPMKFLKNCIYNISRLFLMDQCRILRIERKGELGFIS